MGKFLTETTRQIVEILNDGQRHTGTSLSKSVGVSRTAVWKVINQLKEYGIVIEAQHQGYILRDSLVFLDENVIKNLVDDPRLNFDIFESLSSTNSYLKEKNTPYHLSFCFSEHQSKGRGRLGRTWASPFGRNLYFSFYYMFNKDMSEMSGLSLAVALLVVKALTFFDDTLEIYLKWPNDFVIKGQKLGGILIDLVAEANGRCTAIIGIGINVNMKDFSMDDVDQPWTSLEHILFKKCDRNVIASYVIRSLLEGIQMFDECGLGIFLEDWKKHDLLYGKSISLRLNHATHTGVSHGINSQGHLLLQLPSGEVKSFSAGETSLIRMESS